ncbi:hypothetical protein QUV83_07325 [Cellulomonas cellasea]|nr:hypothetical protein [Cellulomonas cellasea]MDM8084568.1 hypothetical protein [Cellulomonas cellasea]
MRDGFLRRAFIDLVGGVESAGHNSPSAASLQVLVGRLRVTGVEADGS